MRAFTPEEKRAIVDDLYACWIQEPHLRLGQLLFCSIDNDDLFAIEDRNLLRRIRNFIQRKDVE